MSEKRPFKIARGSPAALSQRDIERRAMGEGDLRVDKLIASRPLYLTVRPDDAAKARFSPVEVHAEELRVLVEEGVTPDSVREKLELSGKEPDRFGALKPEQTEKQQPERSLPKD